MRAILFLAAAIVAFAQKPSEELMLTYIVGRPGHMVSEGAGNATRLSEIGKR